MMRLRFGTNFGYTKGHLTLGSVTKKSSTLAWKGRLQLPRSDMRAKIPRHNSIDIQDARDRMVNIKDARIEHTDTQSISPARWRSKSKSGER